MRIECGSCGAKYSIADEKVFGKVFKVRCKKCGNMINVDGTSMGDDAEEATRVFDMNAKGAAAEQAAAGPEWYVVIEEEQAGPFTTEQIEERIQQGMLDADSFAWKEGMGDWERLADIDAFAALVPEAVAAPQPAALGAPAMSEEATRVVSASESISADAGAGPAAVASFPSGGFSSVPAASADAFASSAGAASSDEDIFSAVGSEPSESSSPAFVGARSESSVLFSLDSLTGVRNKDEKPSSAAASVPRTEESGLINLEALIATRSQGSDGAASPGTDGAAPAVVSPATIAVGATSLPKPADRSRVAIVALLVVLLLAIPLTGVAVWLLLGSDSEAEPGSVDSVVAAVAEQPATEEPPAEASPSEEAVADETAAAGAGEDIDGDEERVVAVEDDEEADDAEEEVEERVADAAPAERAAATERAAPAPREAAPAPAEPRQERTERREEPSPSPDRSARTPARESADTGDDRVSSVLRAVRGEDEPAARESAAPRREARPQPSGLPEQLTRDDVAVTVRNYGRQISRCKHSDDQAGVYVGRWVIQPSGSVTNAQVNNMNETGQCILGVIRNFSFPRFTGDAITIPRFNFTIN